MTHITKDYLLKCLINSKFSCKTDKNVEMKQAIEHVGKKCISKPFAWLNTNYFKFCVEKKKLLSQKERKYHSLGVDCVTCYSTECFTLISYFCRYDNNPMR